ncbi:CIA30 family protein [Thiomicrospira sp. WB1]|uniref:CIA30 family protein n=1 Tax=Thiomicrospira sp. WB1 TaxID=1685380 RepID=UPI0007463F82|nr:CIA30 family protein [Thiomicrospira sp. WB1]KUJ72051.1 hypothetical protein AVO41_06325 [Thiomicrospira sp. WB1]
MEHHPLYQGADAPHHNRWRLVTDQVMGGHSQAQMQSDDSGLHLTCHISLDDNGGFVQVQWPLKGIASLASYTGLYMDACSDSAVSVDWVLKSSQLWLPWQSYRQSAVVGTAWQRFYAPFSAFEPYRTKTRLNLARVTKCSLLIGGEAMDVSLRVKAMGIYRSPAN